MDGSKSVAHYHPHCHPHCHPPHPHPHCHPLTHLHSSHSLPHSPPLTPPLTLTHTHPHSPSLPVTPRRDGESDGDGPSPADAPPTEAELQAGCTAVVALLKGTKLYVANAGDSRAVISKAGVAEALSIDHKPTQDRERDRIVGAGGFVSEIGGVARVNANLNLSRAIGDLRYKTNRALSPSEQIITAEPDVTVTELTHEHEFLVMACDGVWDVMKNQEVVDFVRERLATPTRPGKTAEETCCDLLDACLAKDPKESRGIGCDNMTAIIVQFRHVARS